MELDHQMLAAHFGLIEPQRMLSMRVLPVASSDGQVVILTDREQDPAAVEDLGWQLSARLELHLVAASAAFDAALIFAATRAGIDPMVYWSIGCDQRFRQRCPLNWFRLERTSDERIRRCGICEREVYLAADEATARALAAQGHCTAQVSVEAGEDHLIGDLAIDPTADPDADPWA